MSMYVTYNITCNDPMQHNVSDHALLTPCGMVVHAWKKPNSTVKAMQRQVSAAALNPLPSP